MTAQHTPGPWTVSSKPSSVVGWPVRAELGTEVADVLTLVFDGQPIPNEAYANARLIAAAPELLEALRSLAGNAGALRAFEWEIREAAGNTNWQCLMDAIAKADAAIAKARGQ